MHDHVIVGGGTAGSVLARRLIDAGRRVLLLESGPALRSSNLPADIRSLFPAAASNPAYLWPGLQAEYVPGRGFHPYPQGRLLGGTSMIMGLMALRGLPRDYDRWESMGARQWNWRAVEPVFESLQADVDRSDEGQGISGPIAVCAEDPARWNPLARELAKTCAGLGWPHVEDFNRDFRDGYGPLPMSRRRDSRSCAGTEYLCASVLQSPLLEVRPMSHVLRLELERREGCCQVAAVWVRHQDGSHHRVAARHVVMTAGALHTPAILMRSGIGDPDELAASGIEPRLDCKGLGSNLQTHAMYNLFAFVDRGAREVRDDWPLGSTYLRYTSKPQPRPGDGEPRQGDMAVYVRIGLSKTAIGRRLASLSPVLNSPRSRGSVRLDRVRPMEQIEVRFNLLSEASDLQRLREGTGIARQLLESARAWVGPAFAARDVQSLRRAQQMSGTGLANSVRARLATAWLAGGPRGHALIARMAGLVPIEEVLTEDGCRDASIEDATIATGHVCGTARMGRADDPMAVTDEFGRLRGIDGLHVADASIMPSVPAANTHLPVIMVAEKVAAGILARPVDTR